MNRCSIILVNWNGWADTIECLESLFKLNAGKVRVIVCDNGSSDDSLRKIDSWARGGLCCLTSNENPLQDLSWPPGNKPITSVSYDRLQAEKGGDPGDKAQLVLIDIGENLGFAGGNNVGLRYLMARGDYDFVWLLNNDTVVAPDALCELLNRLKAKPEAGICGSTLLRYEDPDKVQARAGGWYCKWIGLPWHLGQLSHAGDNPKIEKTEKWMNYVVGASMLVSKKFIDDIGLMCEDYFLYFEETDWAMRAKGKYSLAYAPDSRVFHKVGASIGTSSHPAKKSSTCDFYSVRNRLLFTRRFFPEALIPVSLTLLAAMFARALFGKWARVKMIMKLLGSYQKIDKPYPGLQ